MTNRKDVMQAFGTVSDQTSLGVFVKFAIEGVGEGGFGEDRLAAAAEARGPAAAKELLHHLKTMPDTAKCATATEFVLGYVPTAQRGQADELSKWDSLLAEVFALMMSDSRADPYELGKRLIAAIRQASDFVAPRLRAWGIASK
jgi:hypothetical protein